MKIIQAKLINGKEYPMKVTEKGYKQFKRGGVIEGKEFRGWVYEDL